MLSRQRLSRKKVEHYVLLFLLDFEFKFETIVSPPVPLDEILKFLGLQLEFDNLAVRFGISEKHLGFTSVETGQIFVDESLDPHEHPEREGRQNFTIAHEIAHWYLHRFISNPHRLPAEESYWLEREAEWFASYLLMPERLIRQQWKAKFGRTGPVVITPKMEAAAIANVGSRQAFIEGLTDLHAKKLAPLFKVSREAMRIRLWELELLPKR